MNGARLEETGHGLTVAVGDRYLYSRRDPVALPIRIVRELEMEPETLYLLPSPLLGYGIREFLARLPDNSHILALEIDQDLMALTSPRLPLDILNDPRVLWVRMDTTEALHALLEGMNLFRFRRVRRVDLSGGAGLNPKLYELLTTFLSDNLAAYWRNRYARFRLGRSWIRRLLANVATLEGTLPLSALEVDGAVVVAGAGESLEVALPLLQHHRKKLWILAVDTALGSFINAGFLPDAVFVLETQAWNLLDFHDATGTRLPVLGDLTSYPPSLTLTGGRRYVYSTSFAACGLLDRLNGAGLRPVPFPPLGSVGVAALRAALSLGKGPVLLTGLDFAYRPGKSHARGTAPHRWQLSGLDRLNRGGDWKAMAARPLRELPNRTGGKLRSDVVLEGYAFLLKREAGSDKRIAVLEPGGADLGLPLLSFAETGTLLAARSGISTSNRKVTWNISGAGAFLQNEAELLDRVIAAWDDYAAGRRDSGILLKALGAVDHVYLDFPDKPPLPKDDDAFLARAVKRSRSLRRYLDRLRH